MPYLIAISSDQESPMKVKADLQLSDHARCFTEVPVCMCVCVCVSLRPLLQTLLNAGVRKSYELRIQKVLSPVSSTHNTIQVCDVWGVPVSTQVHHHYVMLKLVCVCAGGGAWLLWRWGGHCEPAVPRLHPPPLQQAGPPRLPTLTAQTLRGLRSRTTV